MAARELHDVKIAYVLGDIADQAGMVPGFLL